MESVIKEPKVQLNKRGLTPEQNRERKALKRQVKELAVQCGLDWGVYKKPFYINLGSISNPADFTATKDYALVHSRTNEVLNSVKFGYTISQNLRVLQLIVLGSKHFRNLKIVNGGSLNGGRRVFVQLSIEGDAFIGKDTVKRFITIIDSNDGSSSLSVGIGDKTMSCQNQFYYFYKRGDAKFRHSANIEEKMKVIPSLIEYALSQSMRMANLYTQFESTPCSRELADDLVRKMLGFNRKSKIEDLNELSARSLKNMNTLYEDIYGEMDGDELNGKVGKGENFWGLLSGVTRWTTHHKQAPRRGTGRGKDNSMGRLEGIMIGNNYKTNLKALDFVLEKSGLEF